MPPSSWNCQGHADRHGPPIHPLPHFPVAPKPITMEQNERTAFARERGGRREVGVELKN